MKQALLLFVKLPIAGKVKTRLGTSVGDAQAALFYTAFVQDLLTKIDNHGLETLIFFNQEEPVTKYIEWLGNRKLFPQRGRNLGERMFNAFEDSFALDYTRCVLTGSDLPDLSPQTIEEGLSSLKKHAVCIGPAKDGGYYLIGFQNKKLTDIPFTAINWSTPRVFKQTIQKFKSNNLDPYILPEQADVDTLQDLEDLVQSKDFKTRCPHTFKAYRKYIKTA
ncbi:TIGR04282 family arsenosugar biosynthesis glycosyltransferase [Maridesulfovibrio ferrireducens]|uniref:TIGR04282 family arsenosugar biosynthesis glycosyltransferase n=1 Tax=Maridesulfovibrio ferrireducens TaxID=246191 RepID=UPI001A1E04EC|nr:TIGR04282 family arsenosugar biosynthesis glycosyltransferase [Maridesulfovibrio ferrireducens]MBI9112289.1 TIGR04282 family arsenosugar biosynthesis glycosyltransferase [Maridesulfovibrio ferrireducens]